MQERGARSGERGSKRAGTFVVFDGAEGVGKSTQIRRVAERLTSSGAPCLTVREPGGTPVGDDIRGIVLHSSHDLAPATEALLFIASRAQHVDRVIAPALARGSVVLCDRFFLATYAYQVAGRGLDEADVHAANRLATGDLVPDLTLIFDLPVEEGLERAMSRSGHDRLERNERDFHARVRDAFRRFATAKWQKEHPAAGRIVLIDASGSEEDVERRVLDALAKHVPQTFRALAASHY
ncbi:MAG TPA: dTMP kinase [Gemmatimonadaceae bacterium]|nr:dTMP kinase [Gemmatimonadaceae bacterium]